MHLNGSIRFGSGTFLMIKGANMTSDSVIQQPKSHSVKPKDILTISCSVHIRHCAAELTSVRWMKTSYYHAPKMIYPSGNQNKICQRTQSGETTCVYYLLLTDLSYDDEGVYYCVVTSCGQMMSGVGTKLYFYNRDYGCSISPVPEITAIIILGVSLAFYVGMIIKRKYCYCTGSNAGSSTRSITSAEGYQAENNAQHAALRENKMDGSRRRRDNTWSECVYLSVKQ
ncbi:uncharacterized protein ABDE67_020821 isoform 2-T2 [Symphorus nematophorus]